MVINEIFAALTEDIAAAGFHVWCVLAVNSIER
jgi:hypothetical protein